MLLRRCNLSKLSGRQYKHLKTPRFMRKKSIKLYNKSLKQQRNPRPLKGRGVEPQTKARFLMTELKSSNLRDRRCLEASNSTMRGASCLGLEFLNASAKRPKMVASLSRSRSSSASTMPTSCLARNSFQVSANKKPNPSSIDSTLCKTRGTTRNSIPKSSIS